MPHYSEIIMTHDERAAYLRVNESRFTHARYDEMMRRLQRDRNLVPIHKRMAKEFQARYKNNA